MPYSDSTDELTPSPSLFCNYPGDLQPFPFSFSPYYFLDYFRFISSSRRKLIGKRGKGSQSTMHGIHQKSAAMFFAEINKSAVTCWNTRGPLRPTNMVEVARDNVTLIYPSDLSVSLDRVLSTQP